MISDHKLVKTKDLSPQQLFEYFAEHVRYEVLMSLNVTSAILQKKQSLRGLEFAAIESYAIHLRNLITFFYPFSLRDVDVCAKHFFVKEEMWKKIRPELSDILGEAKIRADKEVGHLTTSRHNNMHRDKEWDVRKLMGELMPLFMFFCDSADKLKLRPLIDDLLTHYYKIQALPVR